MDVDLLAQATVDSLAHLDRRRWVPHVITIEPSPNRRLHELASFSEEIWDLPDQMTGEAFPEFVLGFIASRGIRLLDLAGSRLGFDLLPDIASLEDPPAVVVRFADGEDAGPGGCMRYATRRYGDLIHAFVVADEQMKEAVAGFEIPLSRIGVRPTDPADAGRHQSELYERLLDVSPPADRRAIQEPSGEGPNERPPLKLRRTPPPERTVSVGVTCFRNGAYLDECVHSIKLQFLPPAHIVVVDDGSDDPETIEALERLDADPSVTVLRQPTRLGPGAARNRALETFDTSYALWIDADDRLLPGALDSMIAKLEEAPEDVGFIYPHVKHTGNRSDYVEMPAYNLWLLMQRDICPSPSMYDMRVFNGKGAFGEDVPSGQESWDLALRLAEQDVRGQHADGPTFLRRERGFKRAQVHACRSRDLRRNAEARHPALYLEEDDIKAEWAPGLSIVMWNEVGAGCGKSGLGGLDRQGCGDFELLAAEDLGRRTRVVVGAGDGAWLQAAIREARGRWVCILTPAAEPALANPAFAEQLLRSLAGHDSVAGLALYSASDLARPLFSRLNDAERGSAQLSGVAFGRGPTGGAPVVELGAGATTLESMLAALRERGVVESRLAALGNSAEPTSPVASPGFPRLDLNREPARDRSEIAMRSLISAHGPKLQTLRPGAVRRWDELTSWMPVDAQPLCRHQHLEEPTRIVTNDRNPPPGFRLEFDLGVTHSFALPGTRRLVGRAGTFELSDEQDELAEGRPLGYVEERQLPLCERLELCEMPDSGDRVLVAGSEDPLHGVARPIAFVGCVQAFPLQPRGDVLRVEPMRAVALYRRVDNKAGRHLYAVETPAGGSSAVAVGALLSSPGGDLVALRMREDGRLVTDLARPGRATRHPSKLARWVARPPTSDAGRYWSPTERATNLVRHWPSRRLSDDRGITLGWLRREARPGVSPLFSTTHPATGDQLITRDLQEAGALGYLPDGILGFALAADDGERSEATPPYTVPWASA